LNESLANRAVIHKPGSYDTLVLCELMAIRRKSDSLLIPGGWIRAVGMRRSEKR